MSEELSGFEKGAETRRKAELAAAIEVKDDVELKLFADKLGVPDLDKLTERKDLVAAIELREEQVAAEQRQRLRDMEAEEAAKVGGQDDKRPAEARAMRSLNAEFCRAIPVEARTGHFVPDDDDPRFGGDHNVKDGKYRVIGSEWIFEIRKKRVVSAIRATPENRYGGKGVIYVE